MSEPPRRFLVSRKPGSGRTTTYRAFNLSWSCEDTPTEQLSPHPANDCGLSGQQVNDRQLDLGPNVEGPQHNRTEVEEQERTSLNRTTAIESLPCPQESVDGKAFQAGVDSIFKGSRRRGNRKRVDGFDLDCHLLWLAAASLQRQDASRSSRSTPVASRATEVHEEESEAVRSDAGFGVGSVERLGATGYEGQYEIEPRRDYPAAEGDQGSAWINEADQQVPLKSRSPPALKGRLAVKTVREDLASVPCQDSMVETVDCTIYPVLLTPKNATAETTRDTMDLPVAGVSPTAKHVDFFGSKVPPSPANHALTTAERTAFPAAPNSPLASVLPLVSSAQARTPAHAEVLSHQRPQGTYGQAHLLVSTATDSPATAGTAEVQASQERHLHIPLRHPSVTSHQTPPIPHTWGQVSCTPMEGVPERLSRSVMKTPAPWPQPSSHVVDVPDTPMEGVPERLTGFARTPQPPPPAPLSFTPTEGLTEKCAPYLQTPMPLGLTNRTTDVSSTRGAQKRTNMTALDSERHSARCVDLPPDSTPQLQVHDSGAQSRPHSQTTTDRASQQEQADGVMLPLATPDNQLSNPSGSISLGARLDKGNTPGPVEMAGNSSVFRLNAVSPGSYHPSEDDEDAGVGPALEPDDLPEPLEDLEEGPGNAGHLENGAADVGGPSSPQTPVPPQNTLGSSKGKSQRSRLGRTGSAKAQAADDFPGFTNNHQAATVSASPAGGPATPSSPPSSPPPRHQQEEPLPGPSSAGPKKRQRRQEANQREKKAFKSRKSLQGGGSTMDNELGVRRSVRQKFRPLEYWRNEYKVFGRNCQSLPTVVDLATRTPDPVWPRPSDKASRQRKRTKQGKQ